jgi:NAD-dependent deacetylase
VAQRQWESGVAVPACDCGGPFKPATISFGQGLVADDLERAFGAANDCELFLAIGTSLVVSPINHMAELALRAGARTAILTASETPFDRACDFKLDESLERLLPELRDRILRDAGQGS